MAEVLLEPAELLYLLSSLSAKSIIGLDIDPSFLEDVETKNAMLRQGYDSLQAKGWFQSTAHEQLDLDDLMMAVAVVADPDLVILTTRYLPGGGQQNFGHYISDYFVIELYLAASEQYRLTILANIDVAIGRIQATLEMAEQHGVAPVILRLDDQVLDQVRQLAETGRLEQGVALLRAHSEASQLKFLEAAATYRHKATLILLRAEVPQILARRQVLLFEGAGLTWIATDGQLNAAVLMETPTPVQGFSDLMKRHLDELSQVQPQFLG